VAIEAGLWAVGLRREFDWQLGRHGKFLTSKRLELCPSGQDVFMGCRPAELVAELDGDALGMAIFDSDAVAMRTYLCGKRGDVVAVEMAIDGTPG
jgi:hypothetical protein